MSPCDENAVRVLSYLDNRLEGQELADFRAHLEQCSNCRASVETERDLSELLRRSRPLYAAPAALRARVAAVVEQHAAPARARKGFYGPILRMLETVSAAPARRLAGPRLIAVTLAVTAVLLAFVPNFERRARAAEYVETAVATHRSNLDGSLPLELHSNSPEQVTAWFSGKLRFPFRLPAAQVTPESVPAYELTGASLVKYRGEPAALVTYRKQNEKISLLIASSESAAIAGGYEVRSGPLTFHYRTEAGFNVITWSTHGLAYALVSSVRGPARESCMVCHQSMADRQNFQSRR
jgi:mycothiol system anti-sigma-R factor